MSVAAAVSITHASHAITHLLHVVPHARCRLGDRPDISRADALICRRATSELQQGQKLFETHCHSVTARAARAGRGRRSQPKLPRATDDAALQRIIRDGRRHRNARRDGSKPPTSHLSRLM